MLVEPNDQERRAAMSDIEMFARDRGMDVRSVGQDAIAITVRAVPDLVVEVTVAECVHEWFIEVRDAATDKKVFEDWYDHEGYSDASAHELERELYEVVTTNL